MSRKKREVSPTGFYHWIVRGIHKKHLFHRPADYVFFNKLLSEYKAIFEITIHHYCFMTNHVHLLIKCPSVESMAKFSQIVQRRYAYYYCGTYKWVGNVFQRGYRSLPVAEDRYLLECGRYIERNPLKANLAKHPGEYPHSSYGYYAMGFQDGLIEPSPAYLGLAEDDETRMGIYTEYVSESRISEEMALVSKIPF